MMRFNVNGRAVVIEADSRISMLDLLRERLALHGTKKGCDQGACGACTILADGERIVSCLALAIQFDGATITTVEGLADDGLLHPLQQAFIEHDGFQCGYCTPGHLCSAIAMMAELDRGMPSAVTDDLAGRSIVATRAEIAERMSGNICRCGAHNGIIDAIAAVHRGGADRLHRPEPSEVTA